MALIILERIFDPATGRAEFESAAANMSRCIETRDIKPIRSLVAADFSRSYCEFDAPDADTLRAALRQAGIRFERVWNAEVIHW